MTVEREHVEASARNAVAAMLEYLAVADAIVPADVIWALGSHDTHVPLKAVECYTRGVAPWLVFSGGRGHRWADLSTTEADLFRDTAIIAGVPADRIIVERHSTNTAENVLFTMPILIERRIDVRSAVLITIPPFQRRAALTVATHLPTLRCVNTPADWGHPSAWDAADLVRVARLCVGEVERLLEYPRRGFIRWDPATLPPAMIEMADWLRSWLASGDPAPAQC